MAFGFSLPKLPPQALATPAGGGNGLTLADKLMAVGALLRGQPDVAAQIPLMAAARRQFQAQQATTSDLNDYLNGGGRPRVSVQDDQAAPLPESQPSSVDAGAMGNVSIGGGAPKIGVSPVSVSITPGTAPAGPPTVRGAMPFLSKLAGQGGNVQPWVDMLKAAQPNVQIANNFAYDANDPSTVGRYFGDAPAKGAEPVYDANRRQVGWHMADGSIQAIQQAAQAQAAGTKAGELPYVGPTAQAQSAGEAAGKLPFIAPTAQAEAAGKAAGENPNVLETHDVNGVPTTMTRQQWLNMAGGGSTAPSLTAGASVSKLDPQAFYKQFVLKHEGGLNPSDLNGSPTMYGFNQAANPDIDVKSLTPDTAAQRFSDKYFAPSGADKLPPALAAVHADTYFINPAKAQQILQQSGGDPGRYMDLREAWLNSLAQNNPNAAKYAHAWAQRNADLRNVAGQLGSAPASASASPAATLGFHGVNTSDQKAVEDAKADALSAEHVSQLAHQFQDLNKKTPTGPGYDPVHIPIPLLDRFNLNIPGAIANQLQPGTQAMDNLSMQMAAGLRAPGQRLTQVEIMKNLQSVPGKTSLPERNDTNTAVIDQRAATKRAYASFVSNWLAQHGSLQGADDAWAQQQPKAGSAPAATQKGQPMQQIRLKSGGVATVVPVG